MIFFFVIEIFIAFKGVENMFFHKQNRLFWSTKRSEKTEIRRRRETSYQMTPSLVLKNPVATWAAKIRPTDEIISGNFVLRLLVLSRTKWGLSIFKGLYLIFKHSKIPIGFSIHFCQENYRLQIITQFKMKLLWIWRYSVRFSYPLANWII